MNFTESSKDYFNEFGYAKIEGFFSKIEIKNILYEYEIFLKEEAPKLRDKDINYSDKSAGIVNSVHKLAIREGQFFWDILHSKKMRELAEIFLLDRAIPRSAEMFTKPAKIGMKSPLHQDNFYWCLRPFVVGNAITIWIALDECDKSNGGLTYLEKTHILGIINHVNSYAPGSSQTIDDKSYLNNYKSVTPELQPGDLLVHDSHTIHYSEDNKSGNSRRGLTLQYQSENAQIDPKMKQHYESELEKQVAKRIN
jgi:phytanoyl-CoA hydroxylase